MDIGVDLVVVAVSTNALFHSTYRRICQVRQRFRMASERRVGDRGVSALEEHVRRRMHGKHGGSSGGGGVGASSHVASSAAAIQQ